MKRLVGLPLDARQEEEIVALLDQAGIDYRVTRTPAALVGGDAIWVPDEDYPRARQLLDEEARAFAEAARREWNAAWQAEHQGSYARWLWNRLRRTPPETLLRALLLIAVLALMLFYPLALLAAGADQTDDPMIRWDCDRAARRLELEMVRPPLAEVGAREVLLLSGAMNFVQCPLDGATWTLLVDIVEYDSGRCEPEPDTIVSLLRNETLVLSRVVVSRNCGDRPVLGAARVAESGSGLAPSIELCVAPSYGAERRCDALDFARLRTAIDDDTLAGRLDPGGAPSTDSPPQAR